LRRQDLSKTLFVIATLLSLSPVTGCGSVAGNNVDGPVVIASVTAEHSTLYPLGNTDVTCSATSKDGSTLSYKWVSNDGTITGEGPTINYEAPMTYGDFNIMVIVTDSQGNSSTGSTKVTVIVRDPSKCCK